MKRFAKQLQIGIIGYAGAEEYPRGFAPKKYVYELAQQVGYRLAKRGVVIITGGKGGVMESAAKGAKLAGGLTIGILKGDLRSSSNKYTDIEIFSGMKVNGLDELLLVNMCDSLIIIGGGAGTLEELAIAYRNDKPIIAMQNTGGWADKLAGQALDERKTRIIESAKTPEEAIKKAINFGLYGKK